MIFVDAHVHAHSSFTLDAICNAAWRNFSAAADRIGHNGRFESVLMLTESAGVNRFAGWRETAAAQSEMPGQWQIQSAPEITSLFAQGPDQKRLVIVAGRQIVTREKLEVLALGMPATPPDGRSIGATVDQVLADGAIAVVPWGAGKWLGRRGKVVRQLIDQRRGGVLHLGDNGNRPWFWPLPPVFAEAKLAGLTNLPGSDPLPFEREVGRTGSYGFYMHEILDRNRPAAVLKKLIGSNGVAKRPYGRPESAFRFFRNQIRMQLVKRLTRR